MGEPKKTLWIEKPRGFVGENKDYKVVKAQNILHPEVNWYLTHEEVEDLIAEGVTVNISYQK